MDDPFPGPCLALLELSWGLSVLLCISGLCSILFSYIYFLLENFSRAKLVTTAESDEARVKTEEFLERLPRILSGVVALESAAKVLFILSVFTLFSHICDSGSSTEPPTPVGVDPASAYAWAFLWTFIACTVWFVFLGRILPAELGQRKEEAIISRIMPLLNALGTFMLPLHFLLDPFRKLVASGLVSPNPDVEAEQIAEEIIDAVEEGEREGVIREDEADMIENIVTLRDVEVLDIMTPRTDMKACEVSMPVKEAVRLAMLEGHSRMPVFEKDHDHIVGVLYLKDILNHWIEDEPGEIELKDLVRKPLFIPETKKVAELFREFRERKIHMAIVLDEYGGTTGIVTNEDILEEIVGEIIDEYDREEESEIRVIDETTLDVSAKLHIDDLNKEYGTGIPESDDFDTIGGYIFSALGRVPESGETVEVENTKLTVLEVGDRRVKRVKVTIQPRTE